jgi:hypothetical protein
MARKMTEWPSKRGPITKIMPSDGCKGDAVPLAVDQWYDFHEFGCHLGNVGFLHSWTCWGRLRDSAGYEGTWIKDTRVPTLYALNMILGRHPDLFFDVEADD